MSLILHTWSRWQTAQSATRGNHSSCVFGKFNANSGAHWDIATRRVSGWSQGGLKLDKVGTWRNTSLAILILLLQFWRCESGTSNLWNWTSTLKELIDSTIDCSGWSAVELLYRKGAHADALPKALSKPCWIKRIEPTMDIWSCTETTKSEISHIESVTEPGRTQWPTRPTCYPQVTARTCPDSEYLICFSCDWSGSS